MKNMKGHRFVIAPSRRAQPRKFENVVSNKYKYTRFLKADWFIFVKNFFCKRHSCSAKLVDAMKSDRQPDLYYGNYMLTEKEGKPHTIIYEFDSFIAAIPHLDKNDKVVTFNFNYGNCFFFILVIVLLVAYADIIIKNILIESYILDSF